ncbi:MULTISPECIES: hypothetical protein [Acinetobacter calcoaceticus/baumannii complex]|uniref:hypothetical protein n=1 Tax=Acinetobacter calcoaceticus/baumannii complex TaxID=909768 RepID=UPI0004614F1E|nr:MULTISPECIES: hypothetical protein [Acinetobacter calcoaceticus/baumannii complex]KCY49723.1 hypothetical protein J715_1503 [Acinetobacter baumannii 1571545]AKJ45962.1 hypothetical protein TE32_10455 [Acinetobacter baumannii]AWW81479.1 hypothetical protein CBL09_10500 [Acinetobacter baumannii]EHU2432705.1 hypothetical protein [Acinetobacter baumannii]EIB6859953.1 hypothetical protein [Acinetobacter baumannii]
MLVFGYIETLDVIDSNGDKSQLEKCRIDSNEAVYTQGDLEGIHIGNMLIRTYSDGFTERFKIIGISGPTLIPGVKKIEVLKV